MARDKRTTYKNNIVIVCEGSDTEIAYLNDLFNNIEHKFDEVKIVPFGSETKSPKRSTSKNSSRGKRTSNPPTDGKSGNFYWEKEEPNAELYNEYKPQPVRYVREAQLFMEENGFVEAWAVYDKDTFKYHEKARQVAESVPNLHIAFSSISFEEWLLLHFERNPMAFLRSCCTEIINSGSRNKKDIGCGRKLVASHPNDCHGTLCVAGYLRKKNYIPDFSKSDQNLFSTYTVNRLNSVRINAAWIKSLYDETIPIYDRNPYTDFDRLLERLLDLTDKYIWMGNAADAKIDGCSISITYNLPNNKIVLHNYGDRTLIAHYSILNKGIVPIVERQHFHLIKDEKLEIPCKADELLSIEIFYQKYIFTQSLTK